MQILWQKCLKDIKKLSSKLEIKKYLSENSNGKSLTIFPKQFFLITSSVYYEIKLLL